MILIENKWEHVKSCGSLYYKRNKIFSIDLSKLIDSTNDVNKIISTTQKALCKNIEYTSGIYENKHYIVAWVDHIRSTPIYYANVNDHIYISDNPRAIQTEADLNEFDKKSELQFAMAGYVTGSKTLICDLNILQNGEFLVWDKNNKKLIVKRYYQYAPDLSAKDNWVENEKKIGNIIDDSIIKIIERANGKTIWVPLSAGLDSRIILCKLHEHGYQNIQTFTYGPRYNFEAKQAKKIAKALNVPWQEIILSETILRKYFESDTRKNFWKYADGLKTIPCMREFSAIYYLHEKNMPKSGDIFINGQSGDFITGGHIPENWYNDDAHDMNKFFIQTIDKHYDLWFDLKTPSNLEQIKNHITDILPGYNTDNNGLDLATYSEIWEYDCRQVCYVVNGQRVYEFFGYEWEMPLWEKTLVDFCQNLPIEQKKGQALFKSYLKDYNYKGLFPKKEPYIWRWPANMLWVVAVAKIIELTKGKDSKNNYYAYMRNKGHYANQYSFFSKSLHKATYKKCRSIISLYIPIWQSENNQNSKYQVVDLTKISS